MQVKWEIGIDEAGRGPLAGPVAVGVVKIPTDFDWNLIPGVGDSKKVSPKKRAEIFLRAKKLKREGKLDYAVKLVSAKRIDKKGIAFVIAEAITNAIQTLSLTPGKTFIKLDGSLKAPREFAQETIIKGDQKELVIGLASILAKETRDQYMIMIAKKSTQYNFETHKGYGTKSHRRAIFENGLSTEHRASYCQNRHLWGKL